MNQQDSMIQDTGRLICGLHSGKKEKAITPFSCWLEGMVRQVIEEWRENEE
jgi:hypothetical protein